jgi:hypothetical protein
MARVLSRGGPPREYGEYPALGINISAGDFHPTFEPSCLWVRNIDVIIGHENSMLPKA